MHKTNWIILTCLDRSLDYGIGTFIKHLALGLSERTDIRVFILKTGITFNNSDAVNFEGKITTIDIPLTENRTYTDKRTNQEKLSRGIGRIVLQYMPQGCNNVIHMNYINQYFIAIELKKTLHGSIIFTQHTCHSLARRLGENYFDTETHTYGVVDKIVTVTQHGKYHLINKGVNATKIDVIFNGINPNLFMKNKGIKIKEKYGLPKNEKIILYSGRIDPIKGLNYLCEAMEILVKRLKNCRLIIAGDGDFSFITMMSKKFSSNISFLGFVPFEDLVTLYHEADIGIIPSLQEQCSYVALEMLFCGLPVVASSVGGLKEIFVHNQNALLTEMIIDTTNIYGISPNVNQMADNMFTLITNKKMRSLFSKNAKANSNNLFRAEIMIEKYIQTIKNN